MAVSIEEKRRKHNERVARWAEKNPERAKEVRRNASRKYHEKHSERVKNRCKDYRERNRNQRNLYSRQWYEENKERKRQYDRERRSGSPEAKVKALLSVAKSRAPKRGLEFDIAITDVEIVTHCPLLGIELGYANPRKHNRNSASLDRIDSSKGYVKGNVWIISRRANTIKSDATLDELERIVEGLKRHQARGKNEQQ